MKNHGLRHFVTSVCLFLFVVLSFYGCGKSPEKTADKIQAFDSETGGSVIEYPGDHKLHDGPVARNDNFQEWLYWTGFPQDPEDGAQLAILVTLFRSYDGGEFKHRYALNIFRLNGDGKQNDLSVNQVLKPLSASAGPTKNGKDMFVQYKGEGDGKDDADGSISITYFIGADTWHVKADNGKTKNDLIALDLVFKPSSRGYVAESPSGIAFQGASSSKTAAYDQKNLRCLSYYYSAPRCTETGFLSVGENKITVNDDTAWFDHQWGGFAQGCNAFNYNWIGARLNNGDRFMVRDWRNSLGQSDPQFRRLAFFPKNGTPKYWQGTEAFELTELSSYTDPESKKTWGLIYNMISPAGNYRLEPICYADQYPYKYWEGGMWVQKLHTNRTIGKVVGKAFLEQSQANR